VYSTRQGLPTDSISALLPGPRRDALGGHPRRGALPFQGRRLRVLEHAHGLPNRLGLLLLEAKDGSLWIATNGGGLVRFRDGVFHPYTTRDGLSSTS